MRVLLAEDSAALRLLYEVWLTSDGLEVAACADGREALTWLEENGAPDAAVLDVGMPYVDGLEVCRSLRALDPHVPILVQTSLDLEREARAAGADRVIDKPGSHVDLLRPLDELVQRRRARNGGGRIRTSVG